MTSNKDIQWHDYTITKKQRREQSGHHSFVLWFTGLSGSGKSTLANAVANKLFHQKVSTYVLDGDNTRFGLNNDLGFSFEDRKENIRRIGEVSKLFVDSGQVIITAFISPFREDREEVRKILDSKEFIEIYIKCPLEECEKRDPKKLYQKARSGSLKNFTGIDSPYEEPANPELVIETNSYSVEECVNKIINYLKKMNLI